MAQHWKKILLSLSATTLLLASCGKKMSKDEPIPVSYSPSVIISSENQVMYAYDPVSGKKHWEYSFAYLPHIYNTDFTPSPAYYNGRVYVIGPNSDTLYKIDATTGTLVQAIEDGSNPYRSIATPVFDGSYIYIAASSGIVYAMDTTGNVQWSFNAGSPIESSPTIYQDNLYVATTGGHVFKLDKTNGPDAAGNPVWDYPGSGVPSNAKFVSSPTIGDPYLYVGSISDSSMYCIYLTPPDLNPPLPPYYTMLRWTYKTNGAIYSSPAAYAGYCIFGSTDYYIYCLDSTIDPMDPVNPTFTPKAYWKTRTNSQVFSSPLAYNQVIYVGSNDQNLYALYMINGGVKWQFKTNGLVKSSPVAYGPNVFIGSYDKNMYAIDTLTGTAKWMVNVNGPVACSPIVDNLTKKTGYNSQISGMTY